MPHRGVADEIRGVVRAFHVRGVDDSSRAESLRYAVPAAFGHPASEPGIVLGFVRQPPVRPRQGGRARRRHRCAARHLRAAFARVCMPVSFCVWYWDTPLEGWHSGASIFGTAVSVTNVLLCLAYFSSYRSMFAWPSTPRTWGGKQLVLVRAADLRRLDARQRHQPLFRLAVSLADRARSRSRCS